MADPKPIVPVDDENLDDVARALLNEADLSKARQLLEAIDRRIHRNDRLYDVGLDLDFATTYTNGIMALLHYIVGNTSEAGRIVGSIVNEIGRDDILYKNHDSKGGGPNTGGNAIMALVHSTIFDDVTAADNILYAVGESIGTKDGFFRYAADEEIMNISANGLMALAHHSVNHKEFAQVIAKKLVDNVEKAGVLYRDEYHEISPNTNAVMAMVHHIILDDAGRAREIADAIESTIGKEAELYKESPVSNKTYTADTGLVAIMSAVLGGHKSG